MELLYKQEIAYSEWLSGEAVMDIGPTELIIILLIVVLLFGVGRISKVAGELGSGIRAFKEGLQGKGEEKAETKPAPEAAPDEKQI